MRTAICACLFAGMVFGDGGTVILREQAGALTITVFSAEKPLRAGSADLSVMVQESRTAAPVTNTRVLLRLSKQGEPEIRAEATQSLATNKLLYAANPVIPSPGKWLLATEVESGGATVVVDGVLDVLSARPAIWKWWPYFGAVPACVFLYFLNQWLKAKQRAAGLNLPGRW